jgi:hypothetical protein
LVKRTCDGEEGVRDVEVPACFYFPAMASRRGCLQWLPARRQQSTAQPRLLLPTRAPPLFPPLLFLRRRTGKGQNPNATWPEGGAWPLGCRRGQCGARARTRCALVAGTADAPTWRRHSGWSRRGERVEGSFPLGEAPRRAHERALARRGCQPAACLSHRARAGAARWGAAWCEGEREKVRRKKRGRG